jgi:hypothetical protein
MKTQTYTVHEQEIIDHKKKRYARLALNNAVASGKIEKPHQCELCVERTLLHGHHIDYGRPLDVVWLCAKCHGKAHMDGHMLNPKLHAQSPMPYCSDKYKRVAISYTVPIDQYIALHREAQRQRTSISQLMQDLTATHYPLDSNQLEFNFDKEEMSDNSQSLQQPRVQSLAEDQSLMQQSQCTFLQKIRSEGDTSVSRVDRELFDISGGYGGDAIDLHGHYATG